MTPVPKEVSDRILSNFKDYAPLDTLLVTDAKDRSGQYHLRYYVSDKNESFPATPKCRYAFVNFTDSYDEQVKGAHDSSFSNETAGGLSFLIHEGKLYRNVGYDMDDETDTCVDIWQEMEELK